MRGRTGVEQSVLPTDKCVDTVKSTIGFDAFGHSKPFEGLEMAVALSAQDAIELQKACPEWYSQRERSSGNLGPRYWIGAFCSCD